MKMYDGVSRTMSDVRFVPRLRKNLIPLNILDFYGYDFYLYKESTWASKVSIVITKKNEEEKFEQVEWVSYIK